MCFAGASSRSVLPRFAPRKRHNLQEVTVEETALLVGSERAGPASAHPDAIKSVTIILATFNGAAFIREQLTSLAAQTYPSLDLIISDDGSSDGTLAIIEEFCC